MKKIILVLSILIPLLVLGQEKKEKIKGTKIVELKTQVVDEFTSLEIGDLFEVELVLKSTPTVSIDADSNFHEYIDVRVINGKLEISASKQFSRYKKLFIEIGVNSKLENIFVKGKAELYSKNKLLSKKLNVESFENSKINLNFTSTDAAFSAKNKSEIKANGQSEILSLNVTDDADVKIDATVKNISVLQNSKSKLVLSGKATASIIQIAGDSFFNSADLISETAVFSATENADSYINVADKLTLDVTGKTNTYILGNSIINLQSFKETASIYKTNKAPSTLKSFLK